jgi:stalled ribosome alternative rescue factor ArfA
MLLREALRDDEQVFHCRAWNQSKGKGSCLRSSRISAEFPFIQRTTLAKLILASKKGRVYTKRLYTSRIVLSSFDGACCMRNHCSTQKATSILA